VKHRPITSAKQLAEVIASVSRSGRIHPATKTFQALRIYANQEYEALEESLPQAIELLAKGGRLAIVTFHSAEDRIVKNFGKQQVLLNQVKLINKKVIKPSYEAIRANPRARSAKLRVMEKI
jgi:16S rRNA (cytosine1402-N4)-methyltransferase